MVALIIYFLCLASLLDGESFTLLAHAVAVSWITTATILRVAGADSPSRWPVHLRYAGRLLAQALPIAAALWLFFPRFGGPLWQLPDDGNGATSGLSDAMSPGDVTDLALSDEIAFRVRFAAAAPPPAALYWRGPVLHDFDGRTWRHSLLRPVAAPLLPQGAAYQYTVSLEPSRRHWLFVLDWPFAWRAPRALLTNDYMLISSTPVTQRLDVTATSYADVASTGDLDAGSRQRDTRLPAGRNPRSLALARSLRDAHPDDAGYIRAILTLFHEQAYFYTLTPPQLADDSVDSFLFDTRRGFCGHYASAFASLVRAAGIPARVVTGYHGGTYNRFAGYWIVRQSDAHAWVEVWLDGRGWVRMDPTSAIAPERVEHGLNDLVYGGAASTSRWQQRTPWLADARLRLDALRLLWRERILRYDQNSQERMLEWLHVPNPDQRKLALLLGASLTVGMAWLSWQVRRDAGRRPKDPLERAYRTLCRRLARIGAPRRPNEGAEAYAARVVALRPDLDATVTALCRRYSDLRYGASGSDRAVFIAAVRRFRPRDFPASS